MKWLVFLLAAWGAAGAVDHGATQVEWIRSRGGFFSDKLEIRRLDPTDSTSPFGIFTKEDIQKNEKIMLIPRVCLLTSGGSRKTCDTTRNLVKQRKLGDASEFAPYVNYVFQPHYKGDLPAAWSPEGQELLKTIIGKEMPPYDVTDVSFENECGGTGDPLEEEAHLIVLRRSWDDLMLPVFDMVNHRNGRWKNVDSNSAHKGDDITVFATRDIQAGEQLYLSYNECADCDYALTYVLQDMVKDFGFVEQYPRRWRFDFDDEDDLVFELDEVPESNELKLTWLSDEPTRFQDRFLRGHLKRLRELNEYVSSTSEKLASGHERYLSTEFYKALVTALKHAIWAIDDEEDMEQSSEECEVSANGDAGACAESSSRVYDPLTEMTEKVDFNFEVCHFWYDGYQVSDNYHSFYTQIQFEHSKVAKDTCLFLNNHLQACPSFRPHYHEVFVHYAARFVNEVKRIAFIGGGDNMILHEILKYPSLEFVVGMELDQMVVRKSFKNFGTEPSFDNEKVQWWFGDGSKSILMLPKEYFGTFDLVLLDLETKVVDMLKVAQDRDIMDAALLLLKPDGVIARNEDWMFGSNKPFMDYMVDLFYVDVPVICHQGITLGSNSVDFLTRPQKDHKVDTEYLKPVDELEDPYHFWYNYRKTTSGGERLCREWPADNSKNPGVLMILEAEDTSSDVESTGAVKKSISEAFQKSGLTLISAHQASHDDDHGHELIFILKEGYAVVRTWTEDRYCAIDLLLWSSFEKQNAAKTELIRAVGSASSSSYRLVTSGMSGSSSKQNEMAGPRANELCRGHTEFTHGVPTKQETVDRVIAESARLLQNKSALTLVLCGYESASCSSVATLEETRSLGKVVPLWACSPPTGTAEGTTSQQMSDCEASTFGSIAKLVEESGRIGSIVLDVSSPQPMGQILHKVLSKSRFRRQLLAENHVVLAPMLDATEKWRAALLDRFRMDFVKFDPAYRSSVFFNSTESSMELGVFSAGDSKFISHLVDVVSKIEEKTGLVSDVRSIRNGINNYTPDFTPTKTFTHADYNQTDALNHYFSQKPMAGQTIFQFENQSPGLPLSTKQVKQALQSALSAMPGKKIEADLHVYDKVGDGCVIAALWPDGNILLSWDGKTSITANALFYSDIVEDFPDAFLESIPFVELSSYDSFPRGRGRVITFQEDISNRLPRWAAYL